MYTFCHVPCNSYTKTRNSSFRDHLATKSGQIGHRPRGGGRSDAQRSYGSGWVGGYSTVVSLRSDQVPVTFCHVPGIGLTSGFFGPGLDQLVRQPNLTFCLLCGTVKPPGTRAYTVQSASGTVSQDIFLASLALWCPGADMAQL